MLPLLLLQRPAVGGEMPAYFSSGTSRRVSLGRISGSDRRGRRGAAAALASASALVPRVTWLTDGAQMIIWAAFALSFAKIYLRLSCSPPRKILGISKRECKRDKRQPEACLVSGALEMTTSRVTYEERVDAACSCFFLGSRVRKRPSTRALLRCFNNRRQHLMIPPKVIGRTNLPTPPPPLPPELTRGGRGRGEVLHNSVRADLAPPSGSPAAP